MFLTILLGGDKTTNYNIKNKVKGNTQTVS